MRSETLTEQAILDGTCAVIVTYGSRLVFLEQVLQAVLQCGAGHVVLVDNGTAPDVSDKINAFTHQWGAARTSCIRLARNGGSAGGFAAGIAAAARRRQTLHIWTLDDDTVPEPDALKALARTWVLMGSSPLCCLASFRQDKRTYVKLVRNNKPNAIQNNSFFGFSVQSVFQKKTVAIWDKDGLPCRAMEMGAYGGLWLHRDWVDRIGLPDERFFLYFDDYDYTLRITRQGGVLWMCQKSILRDIEQSWTEAPSFLHPWLQYEQGAVRPYFSVRNRVFIERKSRKSRSVYTLNMVLFLLIKVLCRTWRSVLYHLVHPVKMLRRWRILFVAIQDGFSGNFENSILESK
ncbi:glycosyltransferase [Acetobacter farinalis]|uniref:Glycosyltransferase n=1 Tax=Acetobacter farinalis TaxID=1260984 RepID=A0ABT3Q754_9PROT|nr:glycosyltransferase [Acetobacter farinalis]MCX2561105.1 glycosyltransferase [Acetobacter farinalis]NHO29646.1 glycosyltransferase [Acetobacter farinalis]